MARPSTHSKDDFVTAAMAIVDAEGLDALSFRRLGDEMGVSHTAVHNYFENKTALVDELIGQMMSELPDGPPPDDLSVRGRLMWFARRTRAIIKSHPRLAAALVSTTGMATASASSSAAAVAILEEGGLEGSDLVQAYLILEGYLFGWLIFEVGDFEDHLSVRQRRLKSLGHPDFKARVATKAQMEATNEAAYLDGFTRLLDSLGL
jgi:AcrR family transcriptional regulator